MKLDRGIHENVPMERYLGDLCHGHSVSGSGLAKIDAQSPAHFFAGWYGNPNVAPGEQTAAMSFGTAFHAYVLEPATFAAEYAVKPEDMSFATKEGKAWRAENATKKIITADDAAMINGMSKAMFAKPKTAALLKGARPEVTLIDQIGGAWIKGRPDAMNDRLRVAVNLKTCDSADPEDVRKAMDAYNGAYYLSAALTLDLLAALTGHEWQYVFLFVEKRAPYESRRVTLKPTVLEWGRMRYRRAVAKFAECVRTGQWPGYADETIEADLPVWAEKQLQARHEAGEFNQAA